MRPRGYFVTGTDTGVGKTFVSTALAHRAIAVGERVFGFKPIETGCTGPLGEDQIALVEAAGGWQSGLLQGVYQFALPAAPLVAAAAESRTIDLEHLLAVFRDGAAASSFTIVEGAGGWRVPITTDLDMSGLATRLDLPVILVARATLGTINHTILSAEAILRDGCALAAIVLSVRPDDDQTLLPSNIAEVARRTLHPIVLATDPTVLDGLFLP
jgi:dethiobiotin synthetase